MPPSAQPVQSEKLCAFCGYNLRGITSDRCPECGQAVLPGPIIPWTYRKRMGLLRAFLRTVWLATFQPAKLALATPRDADYPAAEHFRWLIATLMGIPPALFFLWLIGQHSQEIIQHMPFSTVSPIAEVRTLWYAGALLLPVLPIAALITALLATAAVSYWFGGRNRSAAHRNHAIVLSRFATAPFAWALPLWIIFALCIPFLISFIPPWQRPQTSLIPSILAAVLYALGALVLLTTWRAALVLLKSSTPCGRPRLIFTAIGLLALPMAVGLVWIMIESLHAN